MRRACARGLRVFDYGRSKQGTGSFAFKKNWGFEPHAAALRVLPVQARRGAAEQPVQRQVPAADRDLAAAAARRWRTGSARSSCAAWAEHAWPTSCTWCTACRTRPTRATRCARTTCCKHLAARHRVFLGTFVDDPDDEQHLAAVRELCAEPARRALAPARGRGCASLRGLLSGERADAAPTTADAGAAALGRRDLRARAASTRCVVFSSAMAQYVAGRGAAAADAGRLRRRRLGQVDRVRRPRIAGRCRWLYAPRGRGGCWRYERARRGARRRGRSSSPSKEAGSVRRLAPECAAACRGDGQRRRRATTSRPTPARRVAVRRPADAAAGLHRRDGLLAQRRRGELVRRARCCRRCARQLPGAALLHRRPQPDAGGAGAGRPTRVVGHRHRARRAALPAARRRGRGAAAAGARHPEQGARGDGDGAAGRRRRRLRRRAIGADARRATCSPPTTPPTSCARSTRCCSTRRRAGADRRGRPRAACVASYSWDGATSAAIDRCLVDLRADTATARMTTWPSLAEARERRCWRRCRVRWRCVLLVARRCLAGLCARTAAVAWSSIWARSDTFAHAFLVPPIVALADLAPARRRSRALQPRPQPVAAAAAGAGRRWSGCSATWPASTP